MTRKERREALSGMWGDMPLNQFGIRDDGKFFAWQGKISALLSFEPATGITKFELPVAD